MATILTPGQVSYAVNRTAGQEGHDDVAAMGRSHQALRIDNADLLARLDAAGFGANVVNDELVALRARVAELEMTASLNADVQATADKRIAELERDNAVLAVEPRIVSLAESLRELEAENAELRARPAGVGTTYTRPVHPIGEGEADAFIASIEDGQSKTLHCNNVVGTLWSRTYSRRGESYEAGTSCPGCYTLGVLLGKSEAIEDAARTKAIIESVRLEDSL